VLAVLDRVRSRLPRSLAIALPCLIVSVAAMPQTLPFQRVPGLVAEVLHQFRQTDHHLAHALNENFDGDRLGLATAEASQPMAFDASRNLEWVITDLNGDRRPEVLLMLTGSGFCGNLECPLLVFTERSRRWLLACETSAWAHSAIRLLDRRTAGWREFLVYGRVAWRRDPAAPAGVACVERDPLHHHENQRRYDRHGFPIPWPEVQRRRGLNPDGTPLGMPYDDPIHREWEEAVRAARRLPR
jgi:hypothetical protein